MTKGYGGPSAVVDLGLDFVEVPQKLPRVENSLFALLDMIEQCSVIVAC